MVAEQIYSVLQPLVAGRVWPVVLPDEAQYPALVYRHVAVTEVPFVDHMQRVESYRIQITLYVEQSMGYEALLGLREQVLDVLRTLPEFVSQNFDSDGYEPDGKLFSWIFDFTFRDA